jgi:nicotinamide phosphoribosyltransferase
MVDQYKDKPIVSCVSDSYDIFQACHMVGISLSQTIIDNNITYVIRPDSGDPSEVLIKCLDILQKYFPSHVNEKQYTVLEHVKLLWGDGINHDSVVKIANHIIEAGYSLENIVFGSGGALLQQMNRDTMKFAMKCSTVRVNGVWRDVYKDPITDTSKQSKRGAVKLYQHKTDNNFVTAVNKPSEDYEDAMQLVYTNGRLTRNQSLEEIRNLVNL